MSKLQFDEMEVNTELAKEYFKKKNYKFSNESLDENRADKDGYGNTIFYDKDDYIRPKGKKRTDSYIETEDKLIKLADLVERNSDLFCQIEYLVRKIPVNEVKNYDIKLIVQNLSCSDRQSIGVNMGDTVAISLGENSPLANLGYVAHVLSCHVQREELAVIIKANKDTAAVAQLFVELCHSVGLDLVSIYLTDGLTYSGLLLDPMSVVNTGCIGVVTERCDADSAIDTFLQTTTRYPWKLSRVLVEESVFSSFSKAVAWKAGLKPEKLPVDFQAAADCSTAAFTSNGKTFLINYAGDAASASGAILVEAYRTTKELISFLEKHHALYLSLWASDIAQANEIAQKVSSSIVWINSYGVFDGPPEASKAIYSEIAFNSFSLKRVHVTGSMAQRQDKWAKLSFEKRRKIVQNATDEYCNEIFNEAALNFLKKLRIALRNLKNDNFVFVENDRMCMGLSIPVKYVGMIEFDYENIENLAKMLTNGSAILYRDSIAFLCKYFEQLAARSTGIPIGLYINQLEFVIYDDSNFGHTDCIYNPIRAFVRTKIVWTNFGTIFAN